LAARRRLPCRHHTTIHFSASEQGFSNDSYSRDFRQSASRGVQYSAIARSSAARTAGRRTRRTHGIPLYDGDGDGDGDGDAEVEGIPQSVAELKDAVAGADGVLLATPEYNYGVPGVFKNAIDWMSRPPADSKRVFGGRVVALMGASPGALGTALSQNAWLSVLRTLGTEFWSGGRLFVSRAAGVFDAVRRLRNPRTVAAELPRYHQVTGA